MDKNELSRIADLAGIDHAPRANVLVPDVRSGSTFTYTGAGLLTDDIPLFLVVWFYTVAIGDRVAFATSVADFEGIAAALPAPTTGIKYRGTYSVSVSSASPDFEYRTYWGLTDLAKLQALNDYVHNAPTPFKEVLKRISVTPAMRTEIMGRTKDAAPKFGT